jgi:hypothetical protein
MNCHFRLCTTGAGLLLAFAAHTAAGQSNQEWIAIKQSCGLSSSLDYNSWVAAGSKCNSGATPGSAAGGLTPQQQIGAAVLQQGAYSLGQGLHNWLFGQPQQPTAPLDAAAQQRALAAQQLKNSGIYLLKQKNCVGAINEFQQALAYTPNDANISAYLALAKQKMKDSTVTVQNSGTLGNILGIPPANADDPANPTSCLANNAYAKTTTILAPANQAPAAAPVAQQIDNLFQPQPTPNVSNPAKRVHQTEQQIIDLFSNQDGVKPQL